MLMLYLKFLFLFGILFDHAKARNNAFNLNEQLRFSARTYCEELNHLPIEIALDDVLFLCKDEILIVVKLENINERDPANSFLLIKQYEIFGLSPIMLINNDTYSAQFIFDSKVNFTLLGWTLALDRQSITGSKLVPPISLQPYTVIIEFPNHFYRTETVLRDIFAEPFLKWIICCPISFDFVRKFVVDLHPLESLCEGSKLFSLTVVHTSFQGIVFGLSYNDKVKYFNLASLNNKQICGSALDDCSDLYLIDAVMTSHHLILLTTKGILVSNDLMDFDTTKPEMMSFKLNFNIPKIGKGFEGQKGIELQAIGECDFHSENHIHIKETVFFTLHHRKYVYISTRPYIIWKAISLRMDKNESLIAVTFDGQRQQFIILETNTNNINQISVMQYPTLIRIYKYNFPSSFVGLAVLIHPISRDILVVGNEVWISEDSGVIYKQIYSVKGRIIPTTHHMNSNGEFFFITDGRRLLYGKIGISRMMSSELPNSNFSGFIQYSVFKVLINSSIITIREFQKFKSDFDLQSHYIIISEILNAIELVAPVHFCIQPITSKQAILYQYDRSPNNSDKQVFEQHHVGKILIHKLGGEAIIKEILPNSNPKFKSAVLLNWLVEFSPESENNFQLDIEDYSSGNLLLKRSSGVWTKEYEGKTIILPGFPSILLTNVITEREMEGVATVNTNASLWIDTKTDNFLYNFVSDDKSLLQLAEDKCRFIMDVYKSSKDVTDENYFVIDLNEKLQLDVVIKSIEKDYAALMDVKVYSILKNPNVFNIIGKQERKITEMIFTINITATSKADGVSSLVIRMPDASLKCNPSLHYVLYSCCPESKVFKLNYTLVPNIIDFNYHDLPVNYRPPSQFGVAVPISKNIYNADPSVPRWQDKTLMSQATGVFKQCLNKTTKSQCGCTLLMEESSLVLYSDCKRKVREIRHLTFLLVNFTKLKQQNQLDWASFVSLMELNERKDYSVLLPDEREIFPDDQNTAWFSVDGRLFLKGSGLYHFRVTLHSNSSKCSLTDEFQVFAIPVTLPYPFYYMWNCLVVIITGVVLLATYIWYTIAHPSTNRYQRQHQIKSSSGQSTTTVSKH